MDRLLFWTEYVDGNPESIDSGTITEDRIDYIVSGCFYDDELSFDGHWVYWTPEGTEILIEVA